MSLKQRLIERISLEGPMSVADYVQACLFDPTDGYYTVHVAFGAEGDFITAPMISQIFGEMIGVWVAQVWHSMGCPEAFRLVEIGGGDGTLMGDVLRVAGHVAGLIPAARVSLVEPSLRLREAQSSLGDVTFYSNVSDLPVDLPIIAIANEVLDCLPSRQFVRTSDGWHERRIGVQDDDLIFGLSPLDTDAPLSFDVPEGKIIEVSPAQRRFLIDLGETLRTATGAALLIDYGRADEEPGDTLQALHRHVPQNPLSAPGRHDLTQWANFQAVREIFRNTDVKFSEISKQCDFLRAMGADARHHALITANPDTRPTLERQYNRLMAPDEMGHLFKVVGLASTDMPPLPGLEFASDAD